MRRFRAIIFSFSLIAALSLGASAALAAPATGPGATLDQAGKDALKPIPIRTEVPIPVSPVEGSVNRYSNGTVRDVADYIQTVYNFIISIVGLVAATMMIIGGFQYLTSAGDAGRIGAAKRRMADALIGMVLALSSYALLNTINPALLTFRPLSEGVSAVKTHLSFLAWCEDLAEKGTTIINVSGTECGSVGRYLIGNDYQFCAYRGSCVKSTAEDGVAPLSYKFGWGDHPVGMQTCLQKAGLTSADIEKDIKQGKLGPIALCLPCANIVPSVAHALNMGTDAACDAWQDTVTELQAKTPNQFLWSYCKMTEKKPGCMQVDINCKNANDNGDRHGSECEGSSHSCGCEGYDDSPEPVWMDKDHTVEELENLKGTAGNTWTHYAVLDDFSYHLAGVCAWNPCKDFKDDRVTSEGKSYSCATGGVGGFIGAAVPVAGWAGVGKSTCTTKSEAFKGGCSGPGGARLIPGVRLFISDCRNN